MLVGTTVVGYVVMAIAAVAAMALTAVLLGGHILLKPAKDACFGKQYAAAR